MRIILKRLKRVLRKWLPFCTYLNTLGTQLSLRFLQPYKDQELLRNRSDIKRYVSQNKPCSRKNVLKIKIVSRLLCFLRFQNFTTTYCEHKRPWQTYLSVYSDYLPFYQSTFQLPISRRQRWSNDLYRGF